MLIENWFSTPIWSDQVDLDTEKVAKKCLQLRETRYPNRQFSNQGGWQSCDLNLDEHYEFIDLKKVVQNKIEEMSKSISPTFVCELTNIWININEKGCKNVKHLHPGSTISGTIYIQTDDKTGNIVFLNDHTPVQHYTFNPGVTNLFQRRVIYKPKNGMIIFFPSWIPHLVQPSESNLPRISISFNTSQIFKGLRSGD